MNVLVEDPAGGQSELPVGELVRRRLYPDYRNLEEDGGQIVRNVAAAVGNLVQHLCEVGLLTVDKALEICPGWMGTDRVIETRPTQIRTRLDGDIDILLKHGLTYRVRNVLCQIPPSRLTLRYLLSLDETHLHRLPGFGPSAWVQLENCLEKIGLHPGMNTDQIAFLDRRIEALDLTVRTANVLDKLLSDVDPKCVFDVMLLREDELAAVVNTNHSRKRMVREINEVLASHGLHLWGRL